MRRTYEEERRLLHSIKNGGREGERAKNALIEANLRFVVNNSDYTVTLDGVWTGEESHGFGGRNIYHLKKDDVIQPMFTAVNMDTEEEYLYYGEEYVYDGSNEWFYNEMFDAEYYYQFSIYDIYGDSYITDGVFFTVENGTVYFDLGE